MFPFRELVDRIERKTDLSSIPGAVRLGSKNENGVVLIKQALDVDLDSLPFPRRDLTAAHRRSYSCEWMRPLASIRTSKGCMFKCRFCALWKLTGGRYLTRKPERIVEELGAIEEKYVFFSDDESLLDTGRMEALADLIKQASIKKRYFLYGRSDTIAGHPEMIEKWKKIGLERVFVGLEFYRDDDLKSISKGTTAEKNEVAVRILKGLDLGIYPMFIVRPEFERKDFANLRKHCLGLDLDFIGFSVLTPLPGADFYADVRDRLITSNYDFFDFFHTQLPTKLPIRDFFRELAGLYTGSRSLKNQIKYLSRYRLRELPGLLRKYNGFMKRLKTLSDDYM